LKCSNGVFTSFSSRNRSVSLILLTRLEFTASVTPSDFTILSDADCYFEVDFIAPVDSCFYLDVASPEILSFSSDSECSTYAECGFESTAFRIEITTELPADTAMTISNFVYKEYDSSVTMGITYYPSCASTSNSEDATLSFDTTFLQDIDVSAISLTPSSDVVGAEDVEVDIVIETYTPAEGRLIVFFPELSGSIGMIDSDSACSDLSSDFTSATCTNNGLDELYVDFVMDSSGTNDMQFTVSSFTNAFQTGTFGPVHF
jgi:hypothetical protein